MNKIIDGKYLISLGYKPDFRFSKIINHFKGRTDITNDEIHNYIDKISTITPRDNALDYKINLSPVSDFEKDNILKVKKSMDIIMKSPVVIKGEIMPDACPTGSDGQAPVGSIITTENAIVPDYHSADICCSLYATNLGKSLDKKIFMDTAMKCTHFGSMNNTTNDMINYTDNDMIDSFKQNKIIRDIGDRFIEVSKKQIGTQGDGNHFLFFGQSKNTGDYYLITHHGSRGIGGLLYKKGKELTKTWSRRNTIGINNLSYYIPFDTEIGNDYWEALQLVRKWTYNNHKVIHDKIIFEMKIDKNQIKDSFWNEHNFVFREGNFFHHAKGATPMNNKLVIDELGQSDIKIIPMNMGSPVLLVKKTSSDFAPHGAGRNMSRSKFKSLNENFTDDEIFKKETDGIDVRFYDGLIDISELPSAYKNPDKIKQEISDFDLCKIIDEIEPIGSIMAGKQIWSKRRIKKNM